MIRNYNCFVCNAFTILNIWLRWIPFITCSWVHTNIYFLHFWSFQVNFFAKSKNKTNTNAFFMNFALAPLKLNRNKSYFISIYSLFKKFQIQFLSYHMWLPHLIPYRVKSMRRINASILNNLRHVILTLCYKNWLWVVTWANTIITLITSIWNIKNSNVCVICSWNNNILYKQVVL